jgi:hypothetical protein
MSPKTFNPWHSTNAEIKTTDSLTNLRTLAKFIDQNFNTQFLHRTIQ